MDMKPYVTLSQDIANDFMKDMMAMSFGSHNQKIFDQMNVKIKEEFDIMDDMFKKSSSKAIKKMDDMTKKFEFKNS